MKAYVLLFLYYLLQEVYAAFPVQNSTSLVQISETVDVEISETYVWKTGSWSTCKSQQKCGEGQKLRRIWCVNTAGFIAPNFNCNSSTRPSTIKQCFIVCNHHKYELRWRTTDWSPCIAKTITRMQCSGESISGTSRRTVDCVLTSANLVVESEACEYFWDKPESKMACSEDCPQPCVLSRKNVTCRVRECLKIITWIEETYDVIVAPNYNSTTCSGLISKPVCKKHPLKSCKNLKKSKKVYRTKLSAWSTCISTIPSSDEAKEGHYMQLALHPVIGFSRRNMTCIDEEGNKTDMSFCLQNTPPPLLRQCVVSIDCKVSPWSEWLIQVEGCIASDGRIFPETRVRFRKLLQLPVGIDAKPCPPLYEKRIIMTNLRPCYKYQWYPLEWSDCLIQLHGNNGEVSILKPTCGNGMEYRNLTCLRMKDMVPVDESLCKNPRPSTVRRCKIPCQRDCTVSHWSKWGPCMTFNMSNFREFSENGYRRRVRSVFVNPTNGGKPCPHLEEVRPCQSINFFGWHYGPWSECVTRKNEKCGHGDQSRDVTCLKWNGRRMNDYYCDLHWPTEDTKIGCRVPCPNDCIMSEWSNWSECPPECSHPGPKYPTFYFNRTVLAIAGEGGRKCRNRRREDFDCLIGYCEVYKWATSEWGSCFLPNSSNDVSNRPCGAGVQERKVTCLYNNNVTDDIELCNFLKKPETERECQLPCPVDCVVTNFSDWTPCNGSCESDIVQYRHRMILQSSLYGGKSCPEALVEARPCSSSMDHHCLKDRNKSQIKTYAWRISEWSDCQLPFEKQACGMGFQVRNVSCIESNKDVEPHFCLPSNWTLPNGPIVDVPSGLRSCEVFCSSSCVVSTWTAWSECFYSYDVKRSRHRELVAVGESAIECMKKVDLEEISSCPMIPLNLTDPARDLWMSCIVESVNQTQITRNGQRVFHDCGEGYRYKFGVQLSSSKGIEPGLERDMCWIDCPIDCQMSSWSDWTDCNVPCGQGFRERKRHILVEGNELGRPCPKTSNKTEVQRDVCNIVCMDYYWVTAGWSDCYLENVIEVWNNSECGTGTHYRVVKCFDKRIEEEVPESRCDPYLKPPSVEPCRIYCPGQCVVSEWNISKRCTEPGTT